MHSNSDSTDKDTKVDLILDDGFHFENEKKNKIIAFMHSNRLLCVLRLGKCEIFTNSMYRINAFEMLFENFDFQHFWQ